MTRVSIPADFRRQAASTPDGVAVVQNGVHVTYAEIGRRARSMAERLRRVGVEPATRVALEADPSIDVFIALIAAWELGAICVPLDCGMA
jgi:acyl-CoA synthetase (AMP-forming)/AMP-acid ligase II